MWSCTYFKGVEQDNWENVRLLKCWQDYMYLFHQKRFPSILHIVRRRESPYARLSVSNLSARAGGVTGRNDTSKTRRPWEGMMRIFSSCTFIYPRLSFASHHHSHIYLHDKYGWMGGIGGTTPGTRHWIHFRPKHVWKHGGGGKCLSD